MPEISAVPISPEAEAQLQDCIEEMLAGSCKVFPRALVKLIHDKAAPTFEAHKLVYPSVEKKVRTSSRCIGMFAAAYAEFAGSSVITVENANRAIELVAGMCDAMLAADGLRGRWCPDVPIDG